MRRALFESFYKGNVEVIAKEVVAQNPTFTYRANLDGVYEEYLNQKTALKYLIKNNVILEKENFSELLDGHKVSACITCAIIKVRIIVNSGIDDDPKIQRYSLDKSFRLNEQIALLSGLSCLLEFMAGDENFLYSGETAGKINQMNKTKLLLPKTNYEEKSTYLDSLIRAFYYSNISSSINPLLVSHIFFLIEQYHRKSVELERMKMKFTQSCG